jgi:hypothetical protein
MWWTRQDEIEFKMNRNKEDLRVNRFSAYGDPYNPQQEQESFGSKVKRYGIGIGTGIAAGAGLGYLSGKFGKAGSELAQTVAKTGKTLKGELAQTKKITGDMAKSRSAKKVYEGDAKRTQAEIEHLKKRMIPADKLPAKQKKTIDGKKVEVNSPEHDINEHYDKTIKEKMEGLTKRKTEWEQGKGTRDIQDFDNKAGLKQQALKHKAAYTAHGEASDAMKSHMTPHVGYGAAGGAVVGAGGAAMMAPTESDLRRRKGYAYAETFERVQRFGPAVDYAIAMARALKEKIAKANITFDDVESMQFFAPTGAQIAQIDNALDNAAILSRRFRSNGKENRSSGSREINRPMR